MSISTHFGCVLQQKQLHNHFQHRYQSALTLMPLFIRIWPPDGHLPVWNFVRAQYLFFRLAVPVWRLFTSKQVHVPASMNLSLIGYPVWLYFLGWIPQHLFTVLPWNVQGFIIIYLYTWNPWDHLLAWSKLQDGCQMAICRSCQMPYTHSMFTFVLLFDFKLSPLNKDLQVWIGVWSEI